MDFISFFHIHFMFTTPSSFTLLAPCACLSVTATTNANAQPPQSENDLGKLRYTPYSFFQVVGRATEERSFDCAIIKRNAMRILAPLLRSERTKPKSNVNVVLPLLLLLCCSIAAGAYQVISVVSRPTLQHRSRSGPRQCRALSSLSVAGNGAARLSDAPPSNAEVVRLKEDAAIMRLEAEKMDLELTLSKLNGLEDKIATLKQQTKNDPDKLKKAFDALEEQFKQLQHKISKDVGDTAKASDSHTTNQSLGLSESNNSHAAAAAATTFKASKNVVAASGASVCAMPAPKTSALALNNATATLYENEDAHDDGEVLSGFDKADLDLYIPVALEIEVAMPNASDVERLEAFRATPSLQQNFLQKATRIVDNPGMQELGRLAELKVQNLDGSTSRDEKERLKCEVDALTASLEKDVLFSYSESVYRSTPALTEDAIDARLGAVGALPSVLQTLYKTRHNLQSDADLRLAVLLHHYQEQMQLLEQVKLVAPLSKDVRLEVVQALESLPLPILNHVANALGLDEREYTTDQLVAELSKDTDDDDDDDSNDESENSGGLWGQLKRLAVAALEEIPDVAENDASNDGSVDSIERSRFIKFMYPSFARMEGYRNPSQQSVDAFVALVSDKKAFKLISKPERTSGGYIIRGQNLVDDGESGVKLVQHLQARLLERQTSRAAVAVGPEDPALQPEDDNEPQVDYFYVRDPLELSDRILLVTGSTATPIFYFSAWPSTKLTVSECALSAVFYVSVHRAAPAAYNCYDAIYSILIAGGTVEQNWLNDVLTQEILSLLAIQLVHEVGHRVVAYMYKVRRCCCVC